MEKKAIKISVLIIAVILVAIITVVICMSISSSNNEKSEVGLKSETRSNSETSSLSQDNNSNDVSTISMPIILNDKKHDLKIESTYAEYIKEADGVSFKQNIKVTLDGKVIENIKQAESMMSKKQSFMSPEIDIINGTDNKNYILLKVNERLVSQVTFTYYIIDENGEVLGNIFYSDASVLQDKLTGHSLSMFYVYDNSIQVIRTTADNTAELHEYTITDGKLNDNIIETYSADKIVIAGKSA